MARFNFDLESAEIELEEVNDLLCIYQEFFENECPQEDECGEDAELSARIFAERSYQFRTLIYAAQDKLSRLRKKMKSAIESHFHGDEQKGGDAA